MPTAQTFLESAGKLLQDRGHQYDRPEGERSMGAAVQAFNIITKHNLSEAEGWLLLQILKDVRQWQNPDYHRDSAEDCVAYAALKAEALSAQQKTGLYSHDSEKVNVQNEHQAFVSALSGGVYPKVPGTLHDGKFVPRLHED